MLSGVIFFKMLDTVGPFTLDFKTERTSPRNLVWSEVWLKFSIKTKDSSISRLSKNSILSVKFCSSLSVILVGMESYFLRHGGVWVSAYTTSTLACTSTETLFTHVSVSIDSFGEISILAGGGGQCLDVLEISVNVDGAWEVLGGQGNVEGAWEVLGIWYNSWRISKHLGQLNCRLNSSTSLNSVSCRGMLDGC